MCNPISSANRNGCFRPRILVLVHNGCVYVFVAELNNISKNWNDYILFNDGDITIEDVKYDPY